MSNLKNKSNIFFAMSDFLRIFAAVIESQRLQHIIQRRGSNDLLEHHKGGSPKHTTTAINVPATTKMAEIVLGHLFYFAFNKTRIVAKPTQMNARAAGEQAHHGNVKGKRELRGFRAYDDDCRINLSAIRYSSPKSLVEVRSLTGSE